MRAKKSLGQNFLTSKAIVADILSAAGLSEKDTVLEVGPGKGFLTEDLLKNAGKVIALEKDDRLISFLESKFEKEITEGRLSIVHGDVLEFDPEKYGLKSGRYSVVANIPYYITGQILRLFLEEHVQPEKMVLMVQKEVAERIVARDKKESILSVSVKAYATPKYIKKVPARYFNPEPKVDSAILLVENISKKLFESKEDEKKFFEFIKAGFSHKRKTLLNNLSSFEGATDALIKCDIPNKIRAEKLTLEQWICIKDALSKN